MLLRKLLVVNHLFVDKQSPFSQKNQSLVHEKEAIITLVINILLLKTAKALVYVHLRWKKPRVDFIVALRFINIKIKSEMRLFACSI